MQDSGERHQREKSNVEQQTYSSGINTEDGFLKQTTTVMVTSDDDWETAQRRRELRYK